MYRYKSPEYFQKKKNRNKHIHFNFINMVSFTLQLLNIFTGGYGQNKPRRALIILNPTDGIYNQCFGQPKLAQTWYKKKADHLLAPINALRAWSRNNTNTDSSFFDVTFFTRLKYSTTQPIFIEYANGKTQFELLCNLEGSVLYPSDTGKIPKCCILQDAKDGYQQGIDMFKGAFCGCDPNPQTWGSGKICRVYPHKFPYLKYFATVEHGESNITPWIDGPKGEEVGDYIINSRFGYLEGHPGGFSEEGFLLPNIGEDLYDPVELKNIARDDGKYSQVDAYKILKEKNITELYFSGYGEHTTKNFIEEAQALGFNITIISDAWDSHMYYQNGTNHRERRQNAFNAWKKDFPSLRIQTSTEIVENQNTSSGYNKEFKIIEPECRGKNFAEPKRAFVALNLQKGFLSSCKRSTITDKIVPNSHRIIPRTNAFLEWSLQKDFFAHLYFTQIRSYNEILLSESEYALSEDLFFNSNVCYISYNGSIKQSTLFKSLSDQGVKQLFLAGVALDDDVLETAREAKNLGFSVFILTDLTQSRGGTLQEGQPLESLMKFYYDLADNEKIFSSKTTDLSNDFYKGFSIPFSEWLDEDECIKQEALGVSSSYRLSVVWIITFLLSN